jgi:hypothetical protein
MRRHLAAAAALLVSFPVAPLAAQTFPLVSLQERALSDDDVPRLTTLLEEWAELVRPVADTAWDPLEWVRRPSTHVVVPRGAVYDRACSALVGEAVFTLGAEPAPEEIAELTELLMRHGALMVASQEAPAASRPAAGAAGAPSLEGMMQGMLAGQGMAEMLGAGKAGGATVRDGIRVQQGVRSGPSLRLTGRVDDWYVEHGFTYDGWATRTGDERDGSTLIWGGDGAARDVKVSLAAFNEWAALWPTCAHLPRGPVVAITMWVTEDEDPLEMVRSLETQHLAMLGGGGSDDPLERRFQRALSSEGIEGMEFKQLLLATTDAEWLAGHPAIRDAMVAVARRDPENPVARMVMQHVENSRWFERHRAELEPALAGWRAAFGSER